MKTRLIMTWAVCATLFAMAFTSCSSGEELDEITTAEAATQKPTVCSMTLKGSITGYADEGETALTTRADADTWKEGDRIFLIFTGTSGDVAGEAVYSSTGWNVSYYGTLVSDVKTACSAYYFEDGTYDSGSNTMSFTRNTAVYRDAEGSYTLSGNSITVEVNLTPRFGRIRFTGNAGDEIWLTGLTVRKKFNVGTETFVTSSDTIKETVGSDGTTKYIYATFTNSKKYIGLLTKDAAFTRSFSSDLLASSASGYIAIPTEESHNRWENGLVLTANGVSFKMIAVPGLSTSTHYCIAETETTAELYNKVTSTSTSSYYLTQYPECSVSISKASTFCTNLKSYTHLDFRLPTLSEWTYAASGGNKSKGYTYSGSNDINEVAWYSGNASTTHLVKQKLPNELGIYDMSGNVAEWTITEPTNPTTTYYSTLYCGGSYASGASLNTVSSASYFASSTTSSEYVGFRVVMPY